MPFCHFWKKIGLVFWFYFTILVLTIQAIRNSNICSRSNSKVSYTTKGIPSSIAGLACVRNEDLWKFSDSIYLRRFWSIAQRFSLVRFVSNSLRHSLGMLFRLIANAERLSILTLYQNCYFLKPGSSTIFKFWLPITVFIEWLNVVWKVVFVTFQFS